MPRNETTNRNMERASELRALAARTDDQFRRDWLTAAAESYEKVASRPSIDIVKRN